MSECGNPFTLDQKVVYPSQGVGIVTKVEEKFFKGERVPYYTIFLADSDMTVMVPTHKAEELGIRAIVSACEAERALEFIGEEFEPNPSDWKLRYQMNLDLLKKGTVMDIAAIVRSLYHRSKVKELPIMERKLYDQALKLFQDEIATALNKEAGEVEQLILDHLENR
jgi:CarD family transcriptional regulator